MKLRVRTIASERSLRTVHRHKVKGCVREKKEKKYTEKNYEIEEIDKKNTQGGSTL